MTTTDNTPNILVFHFITTPITSTEEVDREAEEWTRDYVTRGRYYFARDGVALRCAHPLFSQVVGFACAELHLDGRQFTLEDLQVAVGDERQCLRLARASFARRAKFLLFYTPWALAPKYLFARSMAVYATDGSSPAPMMGRMIDLADVVSLGGLVGAPPLHLAIAAQGLGRIPRPLATAAVEQLVSVGDHGPICRELVAHLWASASIYARMHLGSDYLVVPPQLPDGPHASSSTAA